MTSRIKSRNKIRICCYGYQKLSSPPNFTTGRDFTKNQKTFCYPSLALNHNRGYSCHRISSDVLEQKLMTTHNSQTASTIGVTSQTPGTFLMVNIVFLFVVEFFIFNFFNSEFF